MFDNKGQVRVLEAFLAVSVMFSVLVFTAPPSPVQDFERLHALKKLGTQALFQLDNQGVLSELVKNGNWTVLKRSVEVLLPLGVFFNLTIYDEQLVRVNMQEISNSNLSDMQGRDTTSVQYLCATRELDVRFYTIRLQLAYAK